MGKVTSKLGSTVMSANYCYDQRTGKWPSTGSGLRPTTDGSQAMTTLTSEFRRRQFILRPRERLTGGFEALAWWRLN